LVNNAGINIDYEKKFNADTASKTMDVNYYGTLQMCQGVIPMMSEKGRVVNLSSVAGHLRVIPSADIQKQFTRETLDIPSIDKILQDYLSAVADGTYTEKGWPKEKSYSVSKVAVTAMTNVLARENPHLLINSCCPGWVNTEMGNLVGKPRKTEDDGAKIPVRLAVGDIGDVTGKFWENPSIHDTDSGRVSEW